MLRSFINAFLGAVILYVLFRPPMIYLCEKKKWRRGLAAVFLMLVSFVVVMLPVFAISYMLVSRLTLFFSDSSLVIQTLHSLDEKIRSYTGMNLFTEENVKNLQARAAETITSLLGQTFAMLADVAIMYFMLFYLLTNYGKWNNLIRTFVPVDPEKIHEFSAELKSMTFSNALGAPLLALIQGLFAFLGYWIFGIQEPLFWGLMTGFFSFVPVIGSTMIWLPASIVQITSGFMWQGVGILLYGILVIGVVDNVFRLFLQKKFADVHPLVTILGVIAGLPLFGVSGVIFGPLMISYFLLLLKMYQEEFQVTKKH
jgi:predicted PurR-regulated permease PerM